MIVIPQNKRLAPIFWLALGISLAILSSPQAQASERSTGKTRENLHPNIIVILADDLGYGDPHCYNPESKVPTPNLDRLSSEGIRFTDAHTPSSVCTPTRYGLLTGRYCWRSRLKRGVLSGYSPLLIEPHRMTVASLLKANGYRTACVGKWHLGLGNLEPTDFGKPLSPGPNTLGFDSFHGIAASLDMPPYVWIDDQHITAPLADRTTGSPQHRDGRFWRPGKVASGFRHEDVLPQLTAKAVSVIDASAKVDQGKPLFLYVPLTAPHTPWLPTNEFHNRSQAGPYGDFVAQVDATVGAIADAIKRNGMADNTLLIFTSDNGAHWTPHQMEQTGHRANGPWRGQKADIWEGGHRVPLIVRWPSEIRAGAVSCQTVCLTDLLATCAEIVGSKLPDDAGEDSVSILQALRDPAADKPFREALVSHSIDGMFAIRQGDWKLILGVGSGGFTPNPRKNALAGAPPGQLYNLAKDPGETKNVYEDHPDKVERLTALLEKYQQSGRSRPLLHSPLPHPPQPKSASTLAVPRSAQANIVFILADDLGYGDLQCYCPDSKIPTPRLDALAGEGMRFTDAHSPSAVCSPTRYGILTGRYAWRTRLERWVLSPWDPPLIEAGRLTLPAMLRGAGYRTACIGKWHLGWQWPTRDGQPVDRKNRGANVDFSKPIGEGPTARGFDEYFGDDVPNFPPFVFFENDRTLGLPTARKLKSMHGHDGPMLPGFKQEDVMPAITKRAVAFVDRLAQETPKRPFFLYLALTAPHTPIVPADEFRGRSKAGLEGDYTTQVDDTVGKIVDALKRNGQADNSLLIFTSDNGSPGYLTNEHQPGAIFEKHGHRPSGPLRGLKADSWEGGHRVPLIVRWPGVVQPGAVCDETTCLIDLMATLAEVVGRKLPEGAAEDSLSMLPLLTNSPHDNPLRETTILHSGDGTFIVRQGAWKLILGRGSGGFTKFQPAKGTSAGQLYRLDNDLAEKHNLYEQHPEIVQRLTRELEKVKSGSKL